MILFLLLNILPAQVLLFFYFFYQVQQQMNLYWRSKSSLKTFSDFFNNCIFFFVK